MNAFVQRHLSSVTGILRGFDRLRFRGTMLMLAHTGGFASFLSNMKVKIKDFAVYVRQTTEQVRQATERVAQDAGRPIIYVPNSSTSKEDLAREVARRDDVKEGLICVLRSVEPCWSYDVRKWGSPELKGAVRKCLHYYHYFLHPQFGFMHARLQSWMPLTFNICLNGREWLARQMDQQKLGYLRADNCFLSLKDPRKSQQLMDELLKTDWRKTLGEIATATNPAHPDIFKNHPYPLEYYWSTDQSEWATDVMFKDRAALAGIYPRLVNHGIVGLGSHEVMRFLGRKVPLQGPLHASLAAEVSTDLRQRADGVRIKHRVNDNSIKMYDKHALVLRFETTINQPRDMKVYRTPQGEPDDAPKKWLPMRKGVADLHRRAQLSDAANERYMESMAAVDHDAASLGELTADLCRRVTWNGSPARAMNPLGGDDAKLLEAIGRGEFAINGFRNRDLRTLLYGAEPKDAAVIRKRSGMVTRKLRLLRAHGLVHKVPKTHRYLLSDKGRLIVAALLTACAANAAKLANAA